MQKEVKQNIDKNLEKLVYISMLCNDTKYLQIMN